MSSPFGKQPVQAALQFLAALPVGSAHGTLETLRVLQRQKPLFQASDLQLNFFV